MKFKMQELDRNNLVKNNIKFRHILLTEPYTKNMTKESKYPIPNLCEFRTFGKIIYFITYNTWAIGIKGNN